MGCIGLIYFMMKSFFSVFRYLTMELSVVYVYCCSSASVLFLLLNGGIESGFVVLK